VYKAKRRSRQNDEFLSSQISNIKLNEEDEGGIGSLFPRLNYDKKNKSHEKMGNKINKIYKNKVPLSLEFYEYLHEKKPIDQQNERKIIFKINRNS
jgi:hypothetical protein